MPVSNDTHESAIAHVTGEAIYVDDIPAREKQLYVVAGCSTIAHGRVLQIDLDAVRSAEGVVDVITAADLPAATDIGPVFPGDALLSDQINFMGQAIFAVAACSHKLAQRAIKLAKIEYEERDALLDLDIAIKQKEYVRPPYTMQRGEADAAIEASPHRLQGTVRNGGQEHFYLEGQVALAIPEEDDNFIVYSSNQNPTEAQHLLAEVLGVGMHKITVETRRMGGGFGGKETQATACCALAAIFAKRQNLAVSCRLSRRDDMIMTGKRHAFRCDYDVGFDEQGCIHGIRYQLAGQCGHSPDLSDAIVDRAMFHCDNAYYLPAATIDGLRCKTHTVSNTAFRGFGGPQGMFAMEAVIDEIAFYLKLDPLVVRRRNFYNTTDKNITPYHQKIRHFNVPEIVRQLEEQADYKGRRKSISEFNAASPILKKGIALTPVKFGISFTVKHLNQGGALLHLYSDGTAQINHGGTEMGQGLMTKIRQIVCRELPLPADLVRVTATRTDKVPNTSPTAASSGTDINGMAALAAAKKIKARLIEFLINRHNVDASVIRFSESGVSLDSLPDEQHYSWPELARAAYLERVPLSATGFYKTPDIHYDRDAASGQPFYYFANGAAVTEVLIDTLTGETRLLRTDILHDVGNSINPAIDIGQIEGAYIQGVGWLTHEELKWDDKGRLLTDSPATYKIPAVSDMPAEFNVALFDNAPNEVDTVFNSKAVGEPPLMLAISAFAAIRDAIASTRNYKVFPPLNAPATPEEILRVCDAIASDNDASASPS